MPKRLAVFCDGTWNDLRTPYLTNVARLAKCVRPADANGVQQIVFYDEGVGVASDIGLWTDRLVRWLGGGFGRGLDRKVEAAYRFLVLNYEPDDEIFVFGFSRGAYTARSLCGLIRKCGILRRDCYVKIPEAIGFYRDSRHPRDPEMSEFREKNAHPRSAGGEDDHWAERRSIKEDAQRQGKPTRFHGETSLSYRMMYLGLWDTVGSLGIPKKFWFSAGLNHKYGFHDTNLSSLVSSARHAVASEENRNVFDASLIDNIIDLNSDWASKSRGRWSVTHNGVGDYVAYNHRPYQQLWFPGDHGAVGGGNPEPGLSSASLLWVAQGAAIAGLALDDSPGTELSDAAQRVNPMANWRIDKKGRETTGKEWSIFGIGGYAARRGPALTAEMSLTTRLRWRMNDKWRPASLKHSPPPPFEPFEWAPSGYYGAEQRMPLPGCYLDLWPYRQNPPPSVVGFELQ